MENTQKRSNMNILKLTIGNYYDNDYSEFIFKTKLLDKDFYDDNFNLTEKFKNWLNKNNPWILEQINNGRMDEIYWFSNESLDEINEL